MVMAYNMKVRLAELPGLQVLPLPAAPHVPFRADAETVTRVRRDHGWSHYA